MTEIVLESETNHKNFMNHKICFKTLGMRAPPMSMFIAGDNNTAAQIEN